MNEQLNNESDLNDVPEAVVQTRRQISIVWLVPIVALLIGGWLAYKAISEKGPTITITFTTAEGLEAGKTKIKYKEVEIGQVEAISVSQDLTHVVVTAELVHGAEKYLTEKTRFWVVRARVAAGQVSGLGTIFSGAFIGIDPGKGGAPTRQFKGLEIPPVVTTGLPGRHFVLESDRLGSLDIGSPVYYRQIKVGQIVSYQLEKDLKTVNLKVFVHAPHHDLVRKNTKFWNASGLDVALNASGIRIRTQSLVTLMLGGIAFDTPADIKPGDPARENEVFTLYETQDDIYQKKTTELRHWILEFKGSVRGLAREAPVEFRGIKIGEVTDIRAEFDIETLEPRILVFVQTDPEAFKAVGQSFLEPKEEMERLVEKGLRAQLKTGSLLTGQLFVDVDFHPDAPPAVVKYDYIYPQLPTIPAPMAMITASLNQLLTKIEKLPLVEIGNSLKNTVQGAERLVNSAELRNAMMALNQTLQNTRKFTGNLDATITPELHKAVVRLNEALENAQMLMQNLNAKVTPEINATLDQTQKTLADIGGVVSPDSPIYSELRRALKELADAAKSIRVMAEYLERHPDSLIYGKGKR
ncbi:MAG: MlaD family protein [Desulfobacterales bacterium]|jgi:paraquat-inducible protein B